MGNNNASVRRSYEEAINQLSSVQLSKITEAYKELHSRGGKRGGLVDRSLFTSYFDVSPVLSERLFEAFDRKKNGLVDFEEFVCGVTLMLHGSFEEKCKLLFDVFNIAGDEGVSYEELTSMLSAIAANTDLILTTFHHPSSSALLEPETSQQSVKRIADAAFEKCDITGTGKLLPLEFQYWLEQNPQILSTLLPQAKLNASSSTQDGDEVTLTGQAIVSQPLVTDGHKVEGVILHHQEAMEVINSQGFSSVIVSQVTGTTEVAPSQEIYDQDVVSSDQDLVSGEIYDQDVVSIDQNVMSGGQDVVSGDQDVTEAVNDQNSPEPVSDQVIIDAITSENVEVVADQPDQEATTLISSANQVTNEVVSDPVIVNQQVTVQDIDKAIDHQEDINKAVGQEIVNSQGVNEAITSQVTEVINNPDVTELVNTPEHSQEPNLLVNADQSSVPNQSGVVNNNHLPSLPINIPQDFASHDIVDTPHHSKSLLEQDDIWQNSFILTQPSCMNCPSELRSLWREPMVEYKVVTQPLLHYTNSDQVMGNVAAVSMDIAGFKELVARGQYPAALELSGRFLTAHGQSYTNTGSSLHTEQTLAMWSGRLLLLFQLRYYRECASELEHFKGFNQSDLFYQSYPNRYGDQRGSMTPFMLRLLDAELPLYNREANVALDRLFLLKESCEKLLLLLGNNQPEATALWRNRHAHVMLAIGNCLLSIQEYTLAIDVYQQLNELLPELLRPTIVSAIGRIHLLLGDVAAAKECFAAAMTTQPEQEHLQNQLNRVAVMVFQSAYAEAYDLTQKMLLQHPDNLLVLNNAAVCAFYTGRQQEALQLLQRATKLRTSEAISINMKAIYDLEASGSQAENKRRSAGQPPRL